MFSRIVYGTRGRRTYYIGPTKDTLKECTEKEFHAAIPIKIEALLKANKPQNTLMQTSKAWPRKSDALGVGVGQKAEAEAIYAKLGVATEIAEDGRAIIRDNAHQRDLLKALGYHNREGGFGTVTG